MNSAIDKPDFLGELPCTECGYPRRSLDRRLACSECGKPGFEGEFVVRGRGTLSVGPAWWRSFKGFGFLSAAVVGLASAGAAGWSQPALGGWRTLLGCVYWPAVGIAVLLWFVVGVRLLLARASRRDESSEGCVWEISSSRVSIRRRCQPTIVIPRSEVSGLHALASNRAGTLLELSQRVSHHKPRNFRLFDNRRAFFNHHLFLLGTPEACSLAIDEIHRVLGLPKGSVRSFGHILDHEVTAD